MENPISLRIWAPNAEGQTRQFTSGWDEYSSYDIPVDPTINGDIDYIVEAKGGFEIYRGVFNSLRYRSREYCIIVELRIKSGFVLVHQSDKRTPVSPGVLLRDVLKHIIDNYLKESFGKYKYLDEDHVAFEAARIQNIIAPYLTVNTWGRRINMAESGNAARIQAASESEVDEVLMAIPTATSLEGYSELVIANFASGSNLLASSVKADPNCKRIDVLCESRERRPICKHELTDAPLHLTLKDFGLDPEVYQDFETILDKANVVDNFNLGKNEFFPTRGMKATLYPSRQCLVVTYEPVEKSQTFDYTVALKGPGDVTQQLKNSVQFRNAPLKGGTISFSGTNLKQFLHSSSAQLKDLFTLPSNSEYTVESVELHGNTISIRVEMRPAYVEAWRNRQANNQVQASRNGNRQPQQPAPAAQTPQNAVYQSYILDVSTPPKLCIPKSGKVDVRIFYGGNEIRGIEESKCEVENGRISKTIYMPSSAKASIEIGSPAQFTAQLVQSRTASGDKLTEATWKKLNFFVSGWKRFRYFYDDPRNYYMRFGLILLFCVLLWGAGYASGVFLPKFFNKEEPQQVQQESVDTPVVSGVTAMADSTTVAENDTVRGDEDTDHIEANTEPACGEAAAPSETADKVGDVKKDDSKAPAAPVSKTEREKAEKQQSDRK